MEKFFSWKKPSENAIPLEEREERAEPGKIKMGPDGTIIDPNKPVEEHKAAVREAHEEWRDAA